MLAAAAILLLCGRTAAAQWTVTAFAGASAQTRTGFLDLDGVTSGSNPLFGAAAAVGGGWWTLEGDWMKGPGFLTGGGNALVRSSSLSTLTLNAILRAPRLLTLAGVRPYVSLGAGNMKVSADDVEGLFPVSASLALVSAGAGLTFPDTRRRYTLRADVRYIVSERDDAASAFGSHYMDLWRITAGVTIRLR